MAIHPLIPAATGFMAGVAAAWALSPPPGPLLAAAGACGLLLAWQGARRGVLPRSLAALFCLFLGAGLFALEQGRELPANDVSLALNGRVQTLAADAIQAPEPKARGHYLTVAARTLDGRPVSGLVRLSLPAAVAPPRVGARLEARLRLKRIAGFANPGCFDYAAHMARRGLRVRAYAGKRSGLRILGPGTGDPVSLGVQRIRARLGRLMDRLAPGPGRGLLRALVLGQRGDMPRRVRDALTAAGAAHLLAISGLHLAMVWGLAYLGLRLALTAWPAAALRWSAPKLAALGALAPCAAYAALAGGSTPTLRALVMAACLAAALLLDRPYRPAGGLALAALVIGIIWPHAPLTLSFQLSFTAVAAILLLAGPLARRVKSWSRPARPLAAVLAWLTLSGVIGLAVWPLAVMHFHQAPLLMLPANALLTPLAGMIALAPALLGAALGVFWPAGGLWLWKLAALPAGAATTLVQWMAGLDGAVYYLAGPGPWSVILLYAGALALVGLKGAWRWRLGAAALALAAGLWIWRAAPPRPDGGLTAWVLDVGQGSSAVVRLPRGQVLAIDGGGWPGSDFDFGKNVVGPFLWGRGFSRLDIAACSHAEADHAGGLAFLVRWFHPRQVWTNGSPPRRGPYGRLLAAARERGAPILGPGAISREMELGGARLLLVWPPADGGPPGLSQNNRSLWLGLGLGDCRLWLPGDAGPRIERLVAPRLPAGGRNILVAPHHGGRGSCTRELLERLRPRAVVFSAGYANRFNMPRPEVTARARAAGARIYSTARRGCIKLETKGRRWRATPFLRNPRIPGGGEKMVHYSRPVNIQ